MEFPRQRYCRGLPLPSPGELSNPGIKRRSPALQADSLLSEPPGKPFYVYIHTHGYTHTQIHCFSCIAGRCALDPWIGKMSWRKKWQPTPLFLPGKSYGQRSLAGYSPWSHEKSWTRLSSWTTVTAARLNVPVSTTSRSAIRDLGWDSTQDLHYCRPRSFHRQQDQDVIPKQKKKKIPSG